MKYFLIPVFCLCVGFFVKDYVEYLDLGCSVMQKKNGVDIKCGRTVAFIANGKDGRDGKDGKDGKNGATAICSMDNLNRWRLANQGLVGLLSSKYENDIVEMQSKIGKRYPYTFGK